MARADILNVLYSQNKSPLEFKFDSLYIPPMLSYITAQDVFELYQIATSKKLSSKIEQKYQMISDIMHRRGFKKYHCGTNRMVFVHLEDHRFVAKIAIDDVGMKDNPAEFKNQLILRPFVTKVFEVSPCGTVGFFERIDPIINNKEFQFAGEDIFNLLVNFIIGKYALEDIGSNYFMNWGIRKGFGPCLLDFPYVYELDGNKMYCNAKRNNIVCGGEIDYDIGFNNLVCTKCGKRYFARELSKLQEQKLIIIKGDVTMKTQLVRNGQVICESESATNYIQPQQETRRVTPHQQRPKYPVPRIFRESDTVAKMVEAKIMANDKVDFSKMTVEDALKLSMNAAKQPPVMNTSIQPQERFFTAPVVEQKAPEPKVEPTKPAEVASSSIVVETRYSEEELKEIAENRIKFIIDKLLRERYETFDHDKCPVPNQKQKRLMTEHLMPALDQYEADLPKGSELPLPKEKLIEEFFINEGLLFNEPDRSEEEVLADPIEHNRYNKIESTKTVESGKIDYSQYENDEDQHQFEKIRNNKKDRIMQDF